MELKRKRARIAVDINVILTTVLDSLEARIIDLSDQGAQIVGAALPKGTKFQIEYMGQTTYAQCMWSEIDRIGVRFPFSMTDGPLYDALMMATPGQGDVPPPASDYAVAFMPSPTTLASGPRRVTAGFGRRGGN